MEEQSDMIDNCTRVDGRESFTQVQRSVACRGYRIVYETVRLPAIIAALCLACTCGTSLDKELAIKTEDAEVINPDIVKAYNQFLKAADKGPAPLSGEIATYGLNGHLTAQDYRLIPYICRLARSEDPKIRYSIGSLQGFFWNYFRPRSSLDQKGKETVRPLVEMGIEATLQASKDTNEHVRAAAVSNLGEIFTPASHEAALAALKDGSWRVKLAALGALNTQHIHLPSDRVQQAKIAGTLQPLLEDPNRLVQKSAAAFLKQLSSSGDVEQTQNTEPATAEATGKAP